MSGRLPDEEQRAIIRSIVGECPQVNVMPSGRGLIEATCHWLDRNAYILLDQESQQVIRYSETPVLPLCEQESIRVRKRRRATYQTNQGSGHTGPFFIKEEDQA